MNVYVVILPCIHSSTFKVEVTLKFYHHRCQPCKELTPRLEQAVSATKGIRLAKMNVDLEADIAGQLRVEVLPTLFLVYEVDCYTLFL
jgi:thioredoxin-like negative regulator of GroEL